MKNFNDIGQIFDQIFEAAQEFGENFKNMNFGEGFKDGFKGNFHAHVKTDDKPPFGMWGDDNVDYYPGFSYPPMNVYMSPEKTLVFEFALSGFNESDISLSFNGDYMVFSARINEDAVPDENVRYFKRRLKLKDIDRQKYYVPQDKFDQEKVKAVFKNGILKVTIPPKEVTETPEGIRIEIVKEGL
jgi:HSP20 family molecular chaperone IbpA